MVKVDWEGCGGTLELQARGSTWGRGSCPGPLLDHRDFWCCMWECTLGVLGVLSLVLVGDPSGDIALSWDRPPFLVAQLCPCCFRGTHLMSLYPDLPASEKGCRSRNLEEKLGFAVVFISQSCSSASFPTVLMTLHMACAPTVLPMPRGPRSRPLVMFPPSRASMSLEILGSLAEPLHPCEGCVSPLADESPCPS